MIQTLKRIAGCVAVCALLVLLSGCPDTGHLRPEPDWTKQGEGSLAEEMGDETDSDGEN